LISNHPFVGGNKRFGHAAMEVMLLLNGYEIVATVDDQEETVLAVASGTMSRDEFTSWVERHMVERSRERKITRRAAERASPVFAVIPT
jgi:death-on-curing protein